MSISGTVYPDTDDLETDDVQMSWQLQVSPFSSAISFNLSYKYRFLSPRMNMDTGYSKDTTVAPIMYKVNVCVSFTGGVLIKLIKKPIPEKTVNKIQQTSSIFLFHSFVSRSLIIVNFCHFLTTVSLPYFAQIKQLIFMNLSDFLPSLFEIYREIAQ